MRTRIQLSHNGLEIKWGFPRWLKVFYMKRRGLCAKQHSEFRHLHCIHKRGHDGVCGCV